MSSSEETVADLSELWAYDEPHPSGGTCRVVMTKKQAIEWTRKIYFHVDSYRDGTDEEVFAEFVAIHWAYKYEHRQNP